MPVTFFRYATIGQTTKLRIIRKSIALGLYHMDVVNLPTILTMNDNIIITSSSDNKDMVCTKRKSTKSSTRKKFLEKAVLELVHKFDEKSYCECNKR